MKRLGILTALFPEAACLMRTPPINRPVKLAEGITLYVSGMGPARAREGAARLLEDGAEAIMSLGTAGALDGALNAGDVLLPEYLIHRDGRRLAVDAPWRRTAARALSGMSFPLHGGDLLHVDEVVRTANDKRELYAHTGARAVDMESVAVIEAANERGVPVLVLRVIVDTARTVIPDSVLRNSDAYGRPRIMGLAGSLFLRPHRIPTLWHLARCYRLAAGRMERLGKELGPLGPPD